MGRTPTPTDRFAALEKNGQRLFDGYGRIVAHSLKARGAAASAPMAAGLLGEAFKLFKKVVAGVKKVLGDVADTVGAIGDELIDILEGIVDTAISVIDELLGALDTITDAAIGAVLGLIEAFKKAIHLVLDFFPKNPLSALIELQLDLLNNILGNLADIISEVTGKLAKTFRTNMYDQVYMIRRARGGAVGEVGEPPAKPE